MHSITLATVVAAATTGVVMAAPNAPVTSAFTYQGELKQAGVAFDGTANFTFRLYDAAVGGNQVGPELTAPGLAVEEGRLTVDLDFGGVFDGTALYLEIDVDGVTLTPRQPLMAAPFAAFALAGNEGPQGEAGPEGPQGIAGPEGPQAVPERQGQ